jgi:hypothetical protein
MISLMLSAGTWLVGSKAGRITFVILATLAATGYLIMASYRSGISAEKAKEIAASLDALRKRVAVDDSVGKMTKDERRAELERWARE